VGAREGEVGKNITTREALIGRTRSESSQFKGAHSETGGDAGARGEGEECPLSEGVEVWGGTRGGVAQDVTRAYFRISRKDVGKKGESTRTAKKMKRDRQSNNLSAYSLEGKGVGGEQSKADSYRGITI